ncbi:MAG: ATP-dependent Clp protease adaptor ClpS [Saprospiraceae bacterium]|nr:ATP-dependent Clp protease adaptor ClpS [Saprospiraceae bacterium]
MLDNNIKMQSKEQLEEDVLLADPTVLDAKLIVYNDDFNTFDWVIESFVKICRHTATQAEQLSYIIHFKGKATVKSGSRSILRPYRDALVDRGLSAVIEE